MRWLAGTPKMTVIEGHAQFHSGPNTRVRSAIERAGSPPRCSLTWVDVQAVPATCRASTLCRILEQRTHHAPGPKCPNIFSSSAAVTSGLNSRRPFRRLGAAGDGDRDRAPASSAARTPTCREAIHEPSCGRRHRHPFECHLPRRLQQSRRRASAVSGRLHVKVRRSAEGSHMCCWPPGGVPNTDDLGLDAAGIAPDARGFIHRRRRPAWPRPRPASGPSAIAMGAGRLPIPVGTITKSLAANLFDGDVPQGHRHAHSGLCAICRSAAGTHRHDGQRRCARPACRPALTAKMRDDPCRPRARNGRDAGLHESDRGRRKPNASWAPRSLVCTATRSCNRSSR